MTDSCKLILDFISCEYELIPSNSSSDAFHDRFGALSEQGK